jgi:hypothetical protein
VSPTLGPYGWRTDLVSGLLDRRLQMRLGDHGCEVTHATEHLKIVGFKSGVGSGISGSQFPEPITKYPYWSEPLE